MNYCESKNRPVFKWIDFISRANAGNVNTEEMAIAKKLSTNWTQCACGNISAEIKRSAEGIPDNIILLTYGMLFGTAIHSNNWRDAERILGKIEIYAKELVRSN